MFSALDENELEVVISAMDERRSSAGENIIVEGEKGDQLFVVEEGVLDCYKQFVNYTSPITLTTFDLTLYCLAWRSCPEVSQIL
jgi:cAMP-dependent protein kinase regulator